MPYVDEGEQAKKQGLPIWLPYAAGVVGAFLAFFLWGLTYTKMNGNQWLAPILTGVIIGGAMRLAGKRPAPRVGLVAVLLSAVTGLVAYVYRHMFVIKWQDPNFKPDANHAINWLFGDMASVIFIAFSAYLAFIIARAYGNTYTGPPPTHQPPPE
ncbi:hypothetical protein OT109_11105 [Phycisphaeraceae bacterium D3-23]